VELVSAGHRGGCGLPTCSTPSRRPRPVRRRSRFDNSGVRCCGGVPGAGAAQAASEPALVALLEARCREITGFTAAWPLVTATCNPCSKTSFPDLESQPARKTPKPAERDFPLPPAARRRSVDAAHARRGGPGNAILDEDGRAELTCHFCNEVYGVEEGELRELIAGAGPGLKLGKSNSLSSR